MVVLDWMMPGSGGRDAARRILDDRLGALIVALTSSDSLEALTEMICAGASCLVAKGGSADQLTRLIARTLKVFAATRAVGEDAWARDLSADLVDGSADQGTGLGYSRRREVPIALMCTATPTWNCRSDP